MNDLVVLDTDVLIDYAHGKADFLEELVYAMPGRIFIPSIVISEYWAGKEMDDSKKRLEMDTALSLFEIADFTKRMAEIVGEWLRHKTYSSGASLADLMIAATVVDLNAKLVTRNRKHFEKILSSKEFLEVDY